VLRAENKGTFLTVVPIISIEGTFCTRTALDGLAGQGWWTMHGSTLWIRLVLGTFLCVGGPRFLSAVEQDPTGESGSEAEATADDATPQAADLLPAAEDEQPNAFSISDDDDPFEMSSWLQPVFHYEVTGENGVSRLI